MTITHETADPAVATEQTFLASTTSTALTDALKVVMPAVTTNRPPVPILAGVLIEGDESGITVSGFDFETSISERIPGVGSGRAVVPAKMLLEIVKEMPKGSEISLWLKGSRVVVDGDGTEYTILCLPSEEFPNLPAHSPMPFAILDPDAVDALVRVAKAATNDPTIPALTRVELRAANDVLTAAATDRYMLADAWIWGASTCTGIDDTVYLKADTIRLLPKVFKGMTVEVTYRLPGVVERGSEDVIEFRSGTRRMTVLVDRPSFPKVRSLWPDRWAYTAAFATPDMVKALKAVTRITQGNKNAAVRLDVAEAIALTCNYDDASARKVVAADVEPEVSGEPHSAGFNAGFLAKVFDILAAERVRMAGSTRRPHLFTAVTDTSGGIDVRVLLMPHRIEG